MNMQKLITGLQAIWEGVARIFSPTDDDYPKTGVQPFDGDVYVETPK